jgi:uracil-DNA glycosylase
MDFDFIYNQPAVMLAVRKARGKLTADAQKQAFSMLWRLHALPRIRVILVVAGNPSIDVLPLRAVRRPIRIWAT